MAVISKKDTIKLFEAGSINQAIEISQAGSYQVAIRNNSSQTVSVTGFVDY